jgi:PadR family transcriptional regulator, regulatory protein PadR
VLSSDKGKKEERMNDISIENVKAQMRKGILEYCIMATLDNGDAYASDIIGKLKEARMIVVEGTLYPLLTRLKNAGLLNYNWVESTQGPPRKYYSLTAEGQQVLSQLHQSWGDLVHSVSMINQTQKN